MLSEAEIKQIFFLSDKPRQSALLADDVDIIQFAQNIAAYTAHQVRLGEHARCCNLARSVNRLVADLLESHQP